MLCKRHWECEKTNNGVGENICKTLPKENVYRLYEELKLKTQPSVNKQPHFFKWEKILNRPLINNSR